MQRLIYLFCLLVVLFFSSCDVMKYVTVSVDYTPKQVFRPDSTKIVLISYFDIRTFKNITNRKAESIKAGALGSLKYAYRQLAQLPNVKVTLLFDSVYFTPIQDSIKKLADKYHSDYVLALSDFVPNIDMTGSDNETVYYSSSVNLAYILYEKNGEFSKTLNGFMNEPKFQQPNVGLIGNLIFQPTVGGNKNSIIATAEKATQNALQDYLPYSIVNQRPLFNDDIFQPAVMQIISKNYSQADTLLRPYLKSDNNTIAGKAAYNLAVVQESEGDIDRAIKTVNISLERLKGQYPLLQYPNSLLVGLQQER